MKTYTIQETASTLGVSEDDVRYFIIDNYDNPDDLETITEAEYEAIIKAYNSTGDGQLTLTSATTIEQKQSQELVLNVIAEIRNIQIQATFENEFLEVVEDLKTRNEAIKEAYEQADLELTQFFAERNEANKIAHSRRKRSITNKMNGNKELLAQALKLKKELEESQKEREKERKEHQDFLEKNSQVPA